jgi:hypothetical protein
MTTTETDCAFLARTPDAYGYWGRHKDGVHHAIASCCDAGANRFGIFLVYRGGPSLSCDPIHGNLQWTEGEPEPQLDGVYTAQGCWLGSTLAEVAKDVQTGGVELEEYALDRSTVQALKNHKPE